MDAIGKAPLMKKVMSEGMGFIFDRPALYNVVLKYPLVINAAVKTSDLIGLKLWGKGRMMPEFAKKTFHEMWKNYKTGSEYDK